MDRIGNTPVAHISLIENSDTQKEELFDSIVKRHTNRRVYTGPPLTEKEITLFTGSYNDKNFSLRIITEPAEITTIAGMMTEAMRIETYNRAMHAETVEMLRFNDGEVEKQRDGLIFPNLGITGMKRFMAELFTSRNTAFDETFLQRTVASIKEGAYSSQAIGLICSSGTTRNDEIMTGRYFTRLFLTAASMNVSLQPMSQIMEIESVKSQFIKEMKIQNEEPQMLFRLGRSEPTPHSARRAIQDIIVS